MAIEEPAIRILLSTVVLWEIAIKRTIGKLTAHVKPGDCGSRRRVRISADQRGPYPFYHRDPFDRMLIARTTVENATLLTRDPLIPQYGISTIIA